MSNFIVGLTGGIGSGKSTVANLFIELGVDVVDADIVAREVVKPNSAALSAIVTKFGGDIVNQQGELNRTKLRSQIFTNEDDKNWLNRLLHPLINQAITLQLQQTSSVYCLLVAPLLLENNLTHLVNKVLVVNADESVQIARTLTRDTSSASEIKAIIASQFSQKQRLVVADDVINNNSDRLDKIKVKVLQLHQGYLTQAAENKSDAC